MKWLLNIFAQFSDVVLGDEAGLERHRKTSTKRRDRAARRRRRDEISDWDWESGEAHRASCRNFSNETFLCRLLSREFKTF